MISRLLPIAGYYKPKPAIALPSKGDLQLGYFGRVQAADFIDGPALLSALSIGALGWWNVPSSEWLKFALGGKTLYVPRGCLARYVSYNQIQGQGLTGRSVTVRGKQYTVRLLTDSEWTTLMPRVTAGGGNGGTGVWDTYTFPEISQSSAGGFNRVGTLTSTTVDGKAVTRALATNVQQSSLAVKAMVSDFLGWRPVLELVG